MNELFMNIKRIFVTEFKFNFNGRLLEFEFLLKSFYIDKSRVLVQY